VPGVLYGLDADPIAISLDYRELRGALTTDAGLNALVSLQIDGADQLAILKDLQRDPVRQEVTHVDFIRIDATARVSVEIPVLTIGDPVEVTRGEGIVDQLMHLLPVSAPATSIPPQIEVDVSDMEIGTTITVADLPPPTGVEPEIELDEPVVIAQITRAALADEDIVGEGEEGEEGAEGEEGEEGEGDGDADESSDD
jgi:large subunit ribosomal protein L25